MVKHVNDNKRQYYIEAPRYRICSSCINAYQMCLPSLCTNHAFSCFAEPDYGAKQ